MEYHSEPITRALGKPYKYHTKNGENLKEGSARKIIFDKFNKDWNKSASIKVKNNDRKEYFKICYDSFGFFGAIALFLSMFLTLYFFLLFEVINIYFLLLYLPALVLYSIAFAFKLKINMSVKYKKNEKLISFTSNDLILSIITPIILVSLIVILQLTFNFSER